MRIISLIDDSTSILTSPMSDSILKISNLYHLKLIQLNPASTFAISSTFTFIMLYFLDNISSALTNQSGSNKLSFILREFDAPSSPI